MTLANLAKSFARTAIPYVVGLILSLALRAGLDLHGYAPEITVAVGSLYYALARLAEEHLSPSFGWLLGVAAAPQYVRQAKGRKRLPKADHGHFDAVSVLLVVLVVVILLVVLFPVLHR